MGHAGADARRAGAVDPRGGAAAVVAGQGGMAEDVAAAAASQQGGVGLRHVREPVRRGAVRARSAQVGPSAWEHVEADFSNTEGDIDRVSSLVLEPGGGFQAVIIERRHAENDDGEACGPECSSCGNWRPCRGGVELIFDSCPDLELPEHTVMYRLRRECLVADDAVLPDGLAQEYSPCRTALRVADLATARSPLLERMLVDAAELADGRVEAAVSLTNTGMGTSEEYHAENHNGEGLTAGALPAGIIEEGAPSEICPESSLDEYSDDFEQDDDGEPSGDDGPISSNKR